MTKEELISGEWYYIDNVPWILYAFQFKHNKDNVIYTTQRIMISSMDGRIDVDYHKNFNGRSFNGRSCTYAPFDETARAKIL